MPSILSVLDTRDIAFIFIVTHCESLRYLMGKTYTICSSRNVLFNIMATRPVTIKMVSMNEKMSFKLYLSMINLNLNLKTEAV